MFQMIAKDLSPYGSSYDNIGGSIAGAIWPFVVGGIVAIVLTILLYVLVFPESRSHTLNGFFKFIKDFFDMKYLLIEKIFKCLYVLNTMLAICIGFFLLFGRTFPLGLCLIIFGPIVQRIMYESLMLGILLVKNTMEINNKLGKKDSNQTDDTYQAQDNTSNQATGYVCPCCGAPLPDGALFCGVCGQQIQYK